MKLMKQVAALPYVETGTGALVLLITTRGLGRWTIPKGWPKPDLSDAEMAAREAFEEAGIRGEIGARPIGNFLYTKRLHLSWPEKASRRTMWVEPRKAASMVRESQLASLLGQFEGSP